MLISSRTIPMDTSRVNVSSAIWACLSPVKMIQKINPHRAQGHSLSLNWDLTESHVSRLMLRWSFHFTIVPYISRLMVRGCSLLFQHSNLVCETYYFFLIKSLKWVESCKYNFFELTITFTTCEGFTGGSEVKASACNAGDRGSIPESGRSPGEGNGNPLQYSCLENPMEGGAW